MADHFSIEKLFDKFPQVVGMVPISGILFSWKGKNQPIRRKYFFANDFLLFPLGRLQARPILTPQASPPPAPGLPSFRYFRKMGT